MYFLWFKSASNHCSFRKLRFLFWQDIFKFYQGVVWHCLLQVNFYLLLWFERGSPHFYYAAYISCWKISIFQSFQRDNHSYQVIMSWWNLLLSDLRRLNTSFYWTILNDKQISRMASCQQQLFFEWSIWIQYIASWSS